MSAKGWLPREPAFFASACDLAGDSASGGVTQLTNNMGS